ncbi:hypothetical protein [Cupriavidus sp. UYPR2.512]|uniref:hypothetical protein n=1 Tax=Cupriavidus sp. UYPR2.512 TaxID=1080187 RepID=UPI001E474CD5|nr:hypothetical protein [Cupriavidus sp. UYPR2.512]
MSVANSLIAKLSGLAPAEVADMRAWVRANDADAPVPERFAQGRHAFAMAMVKLEQTRPAQFWGGLLAFVAIPILALHALVR